jgi:hypothetical protein
VQQFIANYGYLAIFVLMVAESACIPVPSEVTMVFGGALAAGAVAGAHLNLALVIAVGVAGNVVGSYIAWGVGAYGGRAAWRRWGRYVLLRPGDIDRADRWFDRHGTKEIATGITAEIATSPTAAKDAEPGCGRQAAPGLPRRTVRPRGGAAPRPRRRARPA